VYTRVVYVVPVIHMYVRLIVHMSGGTKGTRVASVIYNVHTYIKYDPSYSYEGCILPGTNIFFMCTLLTCTTTYDL